MPSTTPVSNNLEAEERRYRQVPQPLLPPCTTPLAAHGLPLIVISTPEGDFLEIPQDHDHQFPPLPRPHSQPSMQHSKQIPIRSRSRRMAFSYASEDTDPSIQVSQSSLASSSSPNFPLEAPEASISSGRLSSTQLRHLLQRARGRRHELSFSHYRHVSVQMDDQTPSSETAHNETKGWPEEQSRGFSEQAEDRPGGQEQEGCDSEDGGALIE